MIYSQISSYSNDNLCLEFLNQPLPSLSLSGLLIIYFYFLFYFIFVVVAIYWATGRFEISLILSPFK